MSNPSDGYMSNRAEERHKARKDGADSRHRALHVLLITVGFGDGETWEEREIKRHLYAAYALLGLIK